MGETIITILITYSSNSHKTSNNNISNDSRNSNDNYNTRVSYHIHKHDNNYGQLSLEKLKVLTQILS